MKWHWTDTLNLVEDIAITDATISTMALSECPLDAIRVMRGRKVEQSIALFDLHIDDILGSRSGVFPGEMENGESGKMGHN